MISLHRMTDGKASCVRTPLIHLCIQVALLGMMHSQSVWQTSTLVGTKEWVSVKL